MIKFFNRVFQEVPGQHSSEYLIVVLKENISRLKIFSIVLLLLCIPLFITDFLDYSKGLFSEEINYKYNFYLNLSLFIFILIFSLLLHTRRRKDMPPVEYNLFVWLFVFAVLLWAALFSVYEYSPSRVIVMYVIGCFCIALLIYAPAPLSISAYSVSYMVFLIGRYLNTTNIADYFQQISAASIVVVFCCIISIIIYAQRKRFFLHQKKLEDEILEKDKVDQALNRMNQNLEKIVKERTETLLSTNQQLINEIAEKKHLEEILINEKAISDNIINKNPLGIIIYDKDGFRVKYNDAAKKIFKAPPSEKPNLFDIPRFNPDFAASFDDIKIGKIVVVPEIYYNPGKVDSSLADEDVFVKFIIFSILNTSGKPEFFVQIAEDITEKKKSELELKKSEDRYRLLVESITDGIYSTLNGHFTTVNSAMLRMFEYKEEEMIGIPAWNLAIPEKRDFIKQVMFQKSMNNDTSPVEIECLKKSGDVFFAELRICGNLDSDLIYGVVVDINERKQAEEALRENEEKYRDLVNNISDVIFTLDTQGVVTYISPMAEKITDYTVQDIIGKPFIEFIFAEDIPVLMRNYAGALEGKQEPVEFRVLFKNGGIKYVRNTSRAVVQDGRVTGIIGILSDITDRVMAEHNLRFFEIGLKQALDGIAIADMDGILRFANNSWLEMHGYNHDEMVGRHLRICHTEEQLIKDVNPFNEKVLMIGKYNGVVGHVKKDGTNFPTQMSSTLLKDDRGNPLGLLGVARDISDQKRIEENLRLNEKKFRNLFENADSGILIIDLNGNIIEANESLIRILGSPSLEQTKKINILTFQNLIDAGISQKLQEAIATQQEIISEHEYISKWNKKCNLRVKIKPISDDEGNIEYIHAIVYDVTSNIEKEKLLYKMQTELDGIVNFSTQGIAMVNEQNKFIYTNASFCSMLGFSEIEIKALSLYDICFAEDAEKFISLICSHATISGKEMSFRKKDELTLPSYVTIFHLYDKFKKYNGYVLLLKDQTEKNNFIHEIEKIKNNMEILEKSKSLFLDNLSRKIRIPMNSIIGFSMLLKKKDITDKKRTFLLESIFEKGNDLLYIMNDLKFISQINDGSLELNISDCNVNALIQELHVKYLDYKPIKERKIEFISYSEITKTNPIINCDENKLLLVFEKLIENAVNNTYFGSIEIGCNNRDDDYIYFYVKDSGVGIAHDRQKSIFDGNNEAGRNIKSNSKTGFGLQICKGFVESMGGRIWLESEEGRGTVFYFTIPVIQAKD